MVKTPLETWAINKIGDRRAGTLTRARLEAYQLQRLKETVTLARDKSPFYRRLLQQHPAERIGSLTDLQAFPFTTAGDIRRNPLLFLCVSQDQISRVVTLNSSGTTGRPKRIFFTAGEQEFIVDFFHYGMSTLVQPGDTVLILLPGELPGSVGDLLVKALGRMRVRGIAHGFVQDPLATLGIMTSERVDAVVGIPTQLLALANCRPPGQKAGPERLKSLLLTADHVPRAIVQRLEKRWRCRVYNHYGMTEMGLGGGVECEALAGCHMREADLFFEIIDPATGAVLPEGREGELVFTTLTRRGMPLIRYRTGDMAGFIPGPCPCGSVLKRMSPVKDRVKGRIALAGGGLLSMSLLDEALFAVEGVLNFQAAVSSGEKGDVLAVKAQLAGWAADETPEAVRRALLAIPAVAGNIDKGTLTLGAVEADRSGRVPEPGKRVIKDLRHKGEAVHERAL
jgi:phenylacetate-coenzyme A ligase PaaK-like adenylate-forming protein